MIPLQLQYVGSRALLTWGSLSQKGGVMWCMPFLLEMEKQYTQNKTLLGGSFQPQQIVRLSEESAHHASSLGASPTLWTLPCFAWYLPGKNKQNKRLRGVLKLAPSFDIQKGNSKPTFPGVSQTHSQGSPAPSTSPGVPESGPASTKPGLSWASHFGHRGKSIDRLNPL